MILEVSLGEHVRVLIDDELPECMTPEQTDIPDEEPATTALDDEAGS